MLKFIRTVCLLLFNLQLLLAQPVEVYFEQGNRAYSEGKYQDAADLYHKIIEKGVASGEVYFNLGNTYYKLDQIGKTILYYEKAQQYLEGDPALEQNMKLASLKVVDKIEPIPKLFLEEWWNAVTHIFPLTIIAWLSYILFFLIMIFAAFYLLFPKKIFIRAIWIFVTLFVIALSFYLSRIYQFESSKYGVILASKVSVVSEPSLTGSEVFIIHEGTKVAINREIDGWFEISLADGKTGWLKTNDLELI